MRAATTSITVVKDLFFPRDPVSIRDAVDRGWIGRGAGGRAVGLAGRVGTPACGRTAAMGGLAMGFSARIICRLPTPPGGGIGTGADFGTGWPRTMFCADVGAAGIVCIGIGAGA
jgi:hypothetical protein